MRSCAQKFETVQAKHGGYDSEKLLHQAIARDTMELQDQRLEVFGAERPAGRGVRARHHIRRGHWICEYAGDFLQDEEEVNRRKDMYDQDETVTGSYVFELDKRFNNQRCWIDATRETPEFGMGRLINHSRKRKNIFPRIVEVWSDSLGKRVPRLNFFAGRDIEEDEEVLYDYGDYSKAGQQGCPWLQT